ncbi:MAG: DUF6438 domain-containing protein [Asticcacaulis sp.]
MKSLGYSAKHGSMIAAVKEQNNQGRTAWSASIFWIFTSIFIGLILFYTGSVYAKDISMSHTVTCDYRPECAIYSVTIDDNGHVTFEGAGGVIVRGKHSYRVAPDQIAPLLQSLEAVNFWNLPDKYTGPAVDIRGDTIKVIKDGNEKSITDFFGEAAGLPKVIHIVEAKLDDMAKIDDWLFPSVDTLLKLDDENYDYSTIAGAEMALEATLEPKVSDDFITGLLTRGVPLEGGSIMTWRFLKNFDLIDAAALAGRTKITKVILRDHPFGEDETSQAKLARAFAYGIRSGKAEMVRAFLDYNPPMTFIKPTGFSDEMELDKTGALCEIIDSPDALLIAKLLIDAGADVNFRDSQMRTPVLMAANEDVAIFLLENGANARAGDYEDNGLEERASQYNWLRVSAWLNHHDRTQVITPKTVR